MQLILFDDVIAREWKPFTWTRPAGDLVFGGYAGWERAEHAFGVPCTGYVSPGLEGFDEAGGPPVVDAGSDPNLDRLFINSRFIPEWGVNLARPTTGSVIEAAGRIVGYFMPAGSPMNPSYLTEPTSVEASALPRLSVRGSVVAEFWELVTRHGDRLLADMEHGLQAGRGPIPTSAHVIGDASALRIDDDVVIEPGVVIDCSGGPVWLERGVRIRAFTRLAGPARIGAHTTLLGGSFEAVKIGESCKMRGELESTVILAHSNKAHDGFIGHSYVGRWVNLGALTTNSDLKNNYGAIRLATHAGAVDTKAMKVGCFMGDHVKTAIGTLLNTGTIIGPGSNVFGGVMPPRYVPPFSWGTGATVHALDRFLGTAEVAMGRRGVTLSAGIRSILVRAWTATRGSAV